MTMLTTSYTEESIQEAYDLLDFAAGLDINVECDTSLPVSTPAEKREQLFQKRLVDAQRKATKIADRQRLVQERVAKKMTRDLQKKLRSR